MANKPLKVVHVTHIPFALMFLKGQISYLKSQGVEVHVISSPEDGLQQFADENHVPAHGVKISRSISPLTDLKSVFALRRVLRQLKPDVFVAHQSKAGIVGMVASLLAFCPVRIYHNHGATVFISHGLQKKILRLCEFLSCRLATGVLCVSDSVAQKFVNAGICPATKIKTILKGSIDGIDAAERFNPARFDAAARSATRRSLGIPDDALVLGFVARIAPAKGISELFGAWQSLRDKYPKAHLLIVGDFDLRDKVPSEVEAALRSDERIHLPGFRRDTETYYAVMDIMVFPSHHEGFGVVLLEAAAMGLPIVATRVQGIINAVDDGQTGLLVEARNAPELAEATRRYLDDPELRKKHGQAGRERALRDFAPEPIRRALYEEYLAAAGQPAPASLTQPTVSPESTAS